MSSCSSNIWLFFMEVMITIHRGQALNQLRTFCTLPETYTLNMFTPASHRTTGFTNGFVSPKLGYSCINTRQWGPSLISPHFFYPWTFAVDTFFYIEAQKRSRVTKLGVLVCRCHGAFSLMLHLFCFASFFVPMLSLKPRPFVQSSFDIQVFR